MRMMRGVVNVVPTELSGDPQWICNEYTELDSGCQLSVMATLCARSIHLYTYLHSWELSAGDG